MIIPFQVDEDDVEEISDEYVEKYQTQAETVKKNRQIFNKLNDPNLTETDKLKLIDDYNLLTPENVRKLSPSQMDEFYNSTANQFKKDGGSKYSHLETLLSDKNEDVSSTMNNIKVNDDMIAVYAQGKQKFYESAKAGVTVEFASDPYMRKFYNEYWKDGTVKPLKEFISDMRSGRNSVSRNDIDDEDLTEEWQGKLWSDG